jgi:ammonia channel protein AmtB
MEQFKAMGLTLVLSVVATAVIAYGIKAVMGLRPTAEGENDGLDQSDHGEVGYHMDENFARPTSQDTDAGAVAAAHAHGGATS